MSCLVNNANPVIFTFNFQPNNLSLIHICKGRSLRLQGDVILVTFVLQLSFFCLETKERDRETNKKKFGYKVNW